MPIYALGDAEPVIDPTAFVHPDAVLIGNVRLGPESTVWPTTVLRADFGPITVGARTSVQDGSIIHTTSEWPTVIGDDCVVGHRVHMEGCTVENRCLIGSGSVVLNRVVVGEGSIVGAQALVAEDTKIAPGSLAVGVPARVRPLSNDQGATWIKYAVNEYVEAGRTYARDLRLLTPGGSGDPKGQHH